MCWNSLTTWHSRDGKTDPSGLMGGLNLGQGEAGNWEPPEKVCSCWNTSYLACCQGYSGRELLQSWTVHMTGLFFFVTHERTLISDEKVLENIFCDYFENLDSPSAYACFSKQWMLQYLASIKTWLSLKHQLGWVQFISQKYVSDKMLNVLKWTAIW